MEDGEGRLKLGWRDSIASSTARWELSDHNALQFCLIIVATGSTFHANVSPFFYSIDSSIPQSKITMDLIVAS
jgi:hypothetical protein